MRAKVYIQNMNKLHLKGKKGCCLWNVYKEERVLKWVGNGAEGDSKRLLEGGWNGEIKFEFSR